MDVSRVDSWGLCNKSAAFVTCVFMIFEAFLGYDDFEIRGTTFLRAGNAWAVYSFLWLPIGTDLQILGLSYKVAPPVLNAVSFTLMRPGVK